MTPIASTGGPAAGTAVAASHRGASWRALPKACGTCETAYQRYQRLRAEGRWQRIVAALGIEERDVAL